MTNANRIRDDAGDVPGWVLITLMTAGLPAPQLNGVLEGAKRALREFLLPVHRVKGGVFISIGF